MRIDPMHAAALAANAGVLNVCGVRAQSTSAHIAMPSTVARAVLAAWLTAMSVVVAIGSQHLPGMVASHFAANGHANGWMPRSAYIGVMLVLVLALPVVIAWAPTWQLRAKAVRMGADDPADVARITSVNFCLFSAGVAAFLAYVNTLVVAANTHAPPLLDMRALITAAMMFVVFAVGWGTLFARRLQRARSVE